ncbi:hypothetical protein, partial [Sinorhizobium meliloti]|uniref:hypothetical protein n=1 Tax=Rhizobium meliloti TaxID=382 RepID=UPI001F3BFF3D
TSPKQPLPDLMQPSHSDLGQTGRVNAHGNERLRIFDQQSSATRRRSLTFGIREGMTLMPNWFLQRFCHTERRAISSCG